jgi:hypothetical protein
MMEVGLWNSYQDLETRTRTSVVYLPDTYYFHLAYYYTTKEDFEK